MIITGGIDLSSGSVVALASFVALRPDGSSRTTIRWIKGQPAGQSFHAK